MNKGVYKAAFPLHEGRCENNGNGSDLENANENDLSNDENSSDLENGNEK